MIRPNKYINLSESFIGISAVILGIILNNSFTIDALWDHLKKKFIKPNKLHISPTYQKFILVLDFMYLSGMIAYNECG